jgi:hypothetical protein
LNRKDREADNCPGLASAVRLNWIEETQPMTLVIIIVGTLGVALTFWNAVNWYSFQSGYRYHGEFQGKRYECSLRFANSECDTPCFVGADEGALYLLSHPNRKGWWWRYGAVGFKKNLQIPWSDLDYQAGKMFFKDSIRFQIASSRTYFFVPRDIGDKLFVDAQRSIPARA